jgi:hypothetical protein
VSNNASLACIQIVLLRILMQQEERQVTTIAQFATLMDLVLHLV